MALTAIPQHARGPVAAAMSATMMAVGALAVSMVLTSSSRSHRVEMLSYTDPAQNPFLGSGNGGWGNGLAADSIEGEYMGENPDAPGKATDWQWATTTTPDGDFTFGHGKDWIYPDGWEQHFPNTLKGPASYYYNELRWDETAAADESIPEEDTDNYNFVANERSNPDHTTTEPYTHSASVDVLTGPNAVDQITGFDDYLMNSNGIY
eukprot:CAMPEP_0181298604 /NCGR_PEP_ID=MMETSP1101-20121128/5875_1 /TAXON_ID=46948 /ORGANISM="Rhodomonas abbreviata, Strain Caron Lab Isolate" /LENGTH=206 /DNA_ID=CAMNT_0023403645 /DNA_START=8 /DNA_END=628 /DNA_ORIENTATION=+